MHGLRRAIAKGSLVLVLVIGGSGASAGPSSSAVPATPAVTQPASVAVTRAAPSVHDRTTWAQVHDARRHLKPTRPAPIAVPFECAVHAAEAAAKH